MKDNIDNYILLSTYYYCEETEMTSNYKCTFSLEGDESTGVTQKQNAKSLSPVRGYCSPIYRHGTQPIQNYIHALYIW
jgi:hypothetical protein